MKQDSIFSIENNTFQLKIENYYRKENHLTGFNRILKKKLSITNSFPFIINYQNILDQSMIDYCVTD